MQNFTLGKKGLSMLFFAFILLIGSSPSFGQACPTPQESEGAEGTDQTQTFCYLQTVGDIERNGENTAVFQTANTTNDTQPIPATEILENGVYYVGTTVGSCPRVAVTVNVTAAQYPENTAVPGSNSFSISPCVSSNFTAEDLSEFFNPLPNYEIKVYEEEFGSDLASGELDAGESYFVGQVPTGTIEPPTCPSLRVAVGYDPTAVPAPNAESPQNFCQGATVADLVAQGTSPNTQAIRWYRTSDSFQPLSETTVLIDGQTYFATQIINDRNDPFPPCESEERAAVTVTVNPPLESPEPGVVCITDLEATFPDFESLGNFYIDLLNDPTIPRNGTFNPTLQQIERAQEFDEDGLGDFTTTYTFGEGVCDQVDLTLRIVGTEVATVEPIEGDSICASEEGLDLITFLTGNTMGGTFTSDNGTINGNILDISQDGNYIITYTVSESDPSTCLTGTDSEDFTVIVGQNNSIEQELIEIPLCSAQINSFINDTDAAMEFFMSFIPANVDQNGTFNPTIENAISQYLGDPTQPLSTTYTVGDEGCQDSVEIVVNISEGSNIESPEPGEVCITDIETVFPDFPALRKFYIDLLNDPTIPRNGTFNPTLQQIERAQEFDEDGLGDFTTTYTFGEGVCDQVDLTLRIVGTEVATVEPIEGDSICASEEGLDLTTFLTGNTMGGTFTSDNGTINGNILDISQDGNYIITYTVSESDPSTCLTGTDSEDFTVIVGQNNSIEQELIEIPLCSAQINSFINDTDAAMEFFMSFIPANVDQNGTFNPTIENAISQYLGDPTQPLSTTYTVGDEGCQDSVEIVVNISEGSNIESPEPGEVCITDIETVFPDFPALRKFYIDLLNDPTIPRNGTFNPTLQQIERAQEFDEDGLGDFTTTYTFGEGVCDQVDLTLRIVGTEVATVEPIEGDSICASEEGLDLITFLTGNTMGGTFTSDNGTINGNILDISQDGNYIITYTVSESDPSTCLTGTDSEDFTVIVGQNNSIEQELIEIPLCSAQINSFINDTDAAMEFFMSFIPANVDQNGTFNPTIENAISQYLGDPTQPLSTTYTVGDEGCQDSVEIVVNISEGSNIESPEPGEVCITDIETVFPDFPALRKFYIDLLNDPTIPRNGTFNPTLQQIERAQEFDEDGLGDFTTTYTFGEGVCDQVDLTLRIVGTEVATVEPIEGDSICASEEGLDLTTFLTGNTMGGTFTSDNGTINSNILDISQDGNYTITYTVSESDPSTCLTGTDSEDFTVIVGKNNSIPVETISIPLCESQVEAFLANPESAAAYFNGILVENDITDLDGTFANESLEAIYAQWTTTPVGTFNSTYTVGDEGCQDSVDITITVTEGGAIESPEPGEVCITDLEAIFPDFPALRKFYIDLLNDPSIPRNGTFNPTLQQIERAQEFDEDGLGDFTTTYTFGEGVCDQVDLTLRVTGTVVATVETIEGVSVCAAEEGLDLTNFLTDNTMGGTFTSDNGTITGNSLDISEEGDYTITYTVSESDPTTCLIETASTEFTINVTSTGETPVADAEQTFCLIDEPTVADIVVEGENIVIYEDADLITEVDATSPLVDGAVYYAVSTSEGNACGSDAVMITVTLTDADAPTLVIEGNEFCRSDSPTVQELINNLTGNGIQIYSALTGGTALATTTALVDGTTYFASGTNSTTTCESSERLAIQVEVGFCGIPEGFSPNDDGKNDEFVIPDIATDFPNYTIQVYNRWGSLVFEGNASTGDWDGLSNQSATLGDGVLPAGVYFYILDYNDGQTQPVQGKVYLSR